MSKTIETQIEKSLLLVKGFRDNIAELRDKGVSDEALDEIENDLKSLEEQNRQCDELRVKLKDRVRDVNRALDNAKHTYFDMKKIIKNNYLQEEWHKYGVTDKR